MVFSHRAAAAAARSPSRPRSPGVVGGAIKWRSFAGAAVTGGGHRLLRPSFLSASSSASNDFADDKRPDGNLDEAGMKMEKEGKWWGWGGAGGREQDVTFLLWSCMKEVEIVGGPLEEGMLSSDQ